MANLGLFTSNFLVVEVADDIRAGWLCSSINISNTKMEQHTHQASIPDVPERHVIMSLYGHGVGGGRL